MKRSAIQPRLARAIACGTLSIIAALSIRQLRAQDITTQYPSMAPIEQYLMEKDAEIALARSAAPEAISRDATVLVLGRHGYETAVQGSNGFVCMVDRGLVGFPELPEFWNPKIRGANCLNPAAARSILPLAKIRTEMALEGHTQEIMGRLRAALSSGEVPALEPGAMSYMMSKSSYLTDEQDHNHAHLMFFLSVEDPATWGAGLPGSPIGAVSYWFSSAKTSSELNGLQPIHIFSIGVSKWSDGTGAHMD
ncbi:MAG: hypothetical protein WCC26_21345 [Terracidiphilus sp.]